MMPCTSSGGTLKVGGHLGGVQHAEASAGPGADVEQAARRFDRRDDGVHGARDGGNFPLDGERDLAVLRVDDPQPSSVESVSISAEAGLGCSVRSFSSMWRGRVHRLFQPSTTLYSKECVTSSLEGFRIRTPSWWWKAAHASSSKK